MGSGLRFTEEEFQALRTRLAAQHAPAAKQAKPSKYGSKKVVDSVCERMPCCVDLIEISCSEMDEPGNLFFSSNP